MEPVTAPRVSFDLVVPVAGPPRDVFPLLCPVREHDWIPHWSGELIYSDSGVAELGCVFRTTASAGEETWTVSRYQPPVAIGFVRVLAGVWTVLMHLDLAAFEHRDAAGHQAFLEATWGAGDRGRPEGGRNPGDSVAGAVTVAPMGERDWLAWHAPYDDPGSSQSRRLRQVQRRVHEALDGAPPGPLRVLSLCAGQGQDLLRPLAAHPRRADVTALLVEADPRNAARARDSAREAGLDAVHVRVGDAAGTTAYRDAVPADVVLVCGVFGNIPDDDVRATVEHLPELLRTGATVIWTRHRAQPDLTPAIRAWFGAGGFDEVGFDTEPGFLYAVGTHRLAAPARAFVPGVTLFRFHGDGSQARC